MRLILSLPAPGCCSHFLLPLNPLLSCSFDTLLVSRARSLASLVPLARAPGVDINLAAACSELQYLASPVSTNIQSAEQNNQAVNSLALISARYSIHAINTLQQLLAWTIYLLCQALDLRALQRRLALHLEKAISASISKHFSTWIDAADQELLAKKVFVRLNRRMDETSARDLEARLMESYMTAGFEILKFFADLPSGGGADPLRNIM